MDKGIEFFNRGRYKEAKALFERYVESHPEDPEAFFYLGKVETDGTQSQRYFRTVWMHHPTHPYADDALYAICQYHYAKGYYVTAGKMFRNLIKTYPESEYSDDAAYWSASCYLASERPDSALAEWRAFSTSYPESDFFEWAVLGRGDALFALNKFSEAISEYEHIVDSFFTGDVKRIALYRIGQCNERLGNSEDAQKFYNRVMKEFPQGSEWILIGGARKQPSSSDQREEDGFTVQVGAFAHKENAIKLHDILSQKGYEVKIITKFKEESTVLHAVQVGTYRSREEAEITAERLEKEEKLNTQIVSKRVE